MAPPSAPQVPPLPSQLPIFHGRPRSLNGAAASTTFRVDDVQSLSTNLNRLSQRLQWDAAERAAGRVQMAREVEQWTAAQQRLQDQPQPSALPIFHGQPRPLHGTTTPVTFVVNDRKSLPSNLDRLAALLQWGKKARTEGRAQMAREVAEWRAPSTLAAQPPALEELEEAFAELDLGDDGGDWQVAASTLAFFRCHPTFECDDTRGLLSNFERLADDCGWVQRTRKKKRREFLEDVFDDIDSRLGRREVLHFLVLAYRLLDDRAEVEAMSITACKALMQERLFANIWDLADGKLMNFGSLKALRTYSLVNKKIFPLAAAKEGFAKRALLRPLFGY